MLAVQSQVLALQAQVQAYQAQVQALHAEANVPLTLCRPIGLFDGETAKTKLGAKSYASKINAALGKEPNIFGAARTSQIESASGKQQGDGKKQKVASKKQAGLALNNYGSAAFCVARCVDKFGEVVTNC